jgi:hypothetical protein
MTCKDCGGVKPDPKMQGEAEGGLTIGCGTCGRTLVILGTSRHGSTIPDYPFPEGMVPWVAFNTGYLAGAFSVSPWRSRK